MSRGKKNDFLGQKGESPMRRVAPQGQLKCGTGLQCELENRDFLLCVLKIGPAHVTAINSTTLLEFGSNAKILLSAMLPSCVT